jgi:hypothetical protein
MTKLGFAIKKNDAASAVLQLTCQDEAGLSNQTALGLRLGRDTGQCYANDYNIFQECSDYF